MAESIIVAGGCGARLGGDIPKGFIELGGKPIFLHSAIVFDNHDEISEQFLIVPDFKIKDAERIIADAGLSKRVTILCGGLERCHSVLAGLKAASSDWVLIHDAARPFVTGKIISSVLAMSGSFQCAVTTTPIVDTIRKRNGVSSGGTVNRNDLAAVGTPQLFHRETLLHLMNCGELSSGITDEAILFESAGYAVGLATGDPCNFKITSPHDLTIAEAIVEKLKK